MPDPFSFFRRRLRGADIQPFIDEHGIGGNNFRPQRERAVHRQRRLAGRRRTADDESFHQTILLNIFSSSVLVMRTTTGRPCGHFRPRLPSMSRNSSSTSPRVRSWPPLHRGFARRRRQLVIFRISSSLIEQGTAHIPEDLIEESAEVDGLQIDGHGGYFEGIPAEFLDVETHGADIFEVVADKLALEGVEIENIGNEHGLLQHFAVFHPLFQPIENKPLVRRVLVDDIKLVPALVEKIGVEQFARIRTGGNVDSVLLRLFLPLLQKSLVLEERHRRTRPAMRPPARLL